MVEAVGGLEVVEALRFGTVGGVAVGEVVAGGFLLRDGPGEEGAVGAGAVVDAELGVEEVPPAVHVEAGGGGGAEVPVVRCAADCVVDVAILEVGVGREAAVNPAGGADIEVGVLLAAVVVVVALQGVDGPDIVPHPLDLPEVVAAEGGEGGAPDGVPPAVEIAEGQLPSPEEVFVVLEADEVGFGDGLPVGSGEGVQAIFLEGAAGLVLVVISVVGGQVEGGVEAQLSAEAVADEELQVVLDEVVILVGVVGALAVVGGVFAAGVVAAPEPGHLLLRGVVPGHVGALLPSEGEEADIGGGRRVGGLPEVAPELGGGALDIARRADVAQPRVEAPVAPVAADEAGAGAEGLPVGGVGAAGSGEFGVGLLGGGVGDHVDAGAEGSGSVGRGPRSALDLDGGDRRCEVGHVDPVDVVALGIVDGDSVGADVDAGAVGAADAHGGVAGPRAGVGADGDGGGHLQEVGHVAPVVRAEELALPDVGEGHRGARRGAVGGNYLHPAELYFHRIAVCAAARAAAGGGSVEEGPRACREQEGRKNRSLHVFFFLYAGMTRIRFGGYDLSPGPRGRAFPAAAAVSDSFPDNGSTEGGGQGDTPKIMHVAMSMPPARRRQSSPRGETTARPCGCGAAKLAICSGPSTIFSEINYQLTKYCHPLRQMYHICYTFKDTWLFRFAYYNILTYFCHYI